MISALAFVPVTDVIGAFETLVEALPVRAEPIILLTILRIITLAENDDGTGVTHAFQFKCGICMNAF